MNSIKTLKQKLRERTHVKLREQESAAHPEAARKVRDFFLAHFKDTESKNVISGSMPIKNELDPQPLMQALADKGHKLCLPVHGARATPLLFREYKMGDDLTQTKWGIRIPQENKAALSPDILLVPLLAFDRTGARLGYGGGYYDATLQTLRQSKTIIAVGLAFAAQEVEQVPIAEYDQRLDCVITENEVIAVGAGQK